MCKNKKQYIVVVYIDQTQLQLQTPWLSKFQIPNLKETNSQSLEDALAGQTLKNTRWKNTPKCNHCHCPKSFLFMAAEHQISGHPPTGKTRLDECLRIHVIAKTTQEIGKVTTKFADSFHCRYHTGQITNQYYIFHCH